MDSIKVRRDPKGLAWKTRSMPSRKLRREVERKTKKHKARMFA